MTDEQSASTIAVALQSAKERLARAGYASPRLDADVLLRHVLGIDRTRLFLRLQDRLALADLATFVALVEQRADGAPIAYLTGTREFMGLPFAVEPGVLVPRPETELLVEWALAWLTDRQGTTVVDVGTGSGAIALALASRLAPDRQHRFVGADVSAAALAVAARNRARFGLADRVDLVRGDLLTWCGAPVDLLLANLPYLRPDQVTANPELAAEPALALIGGTDGLDLVRHLLLDAPRMLSPTGAVGLEIDPSQADAVRDLVHAAFPTATIGGKRDLAGLARHVIVQT